MSKTVVTGGAGFIGSHLCDALLEDDHEVICVDNFFTGQRRNIEHLLDHPNFTLIEHDIVYPLNMDESIDFIYNLACPASPVHYQYNPIKTVKTSTVGMINMLGMAREKGARLLQASTSEIYGDPDIHPQPETYHGNVNTLSPRACYDEGKRVAETLCMDYHRSHGLDVRIARIFNTYGPRMHPQDGRVVSNFIMQALAGDAITIYGDGSQTRSFCYVDDLIVGLRALMQQDANIGPVNLGNPEEIKIGTLAERIVEMTDSSSEIDYKPLPEDDPRKRKPDITRAEQLLNWKPTTDLETGLRRTIEYFQEISSPRQGDSN